MQPRYGSDEFYDLLRPKELIRAEEERSRDPYYLPGLLPGTHLRLAWYRSWYNQLSSGVVEAWTGEAYRRWVDALREAQASRGARP